MCCTIIYYNIIYYLIMLNNFHRGRGGLGGASVRAEAARGHDGQSGELLIHYLMSILIYK